MGSRLEQASSQFLLPSSHALSPRYQEECWQRPKNGEFVETGVAMNVTSLADMTKSGFSAFARMKKIEYQCETGMCSESIASYKFLNESWRGHLW